MKKLYYAVASVAVAAAVSWQPLAAQTAFPLTLELTDQAAFDTWTTINANNDDYAWTFDAAQSAAAINSSSAAANDYIVSPAVALEAGKTYKVNTKLKSSGSYDYQDYQILAGTTADATSLDGNVIYTETKFRVNTYFADRGGNFTPTESGNYYFAIKCTSGKWNGTLYFEKLTVDVVVPYPGKVTSISAAAAPKGAMEATVSWTWPTQTDLGTALTSITGAKVYRGTTSSFTANDASFVGTAEGGEPGGKGSWVDNTITEPGKYYYKIIPFNENGPSPVAPSASTVSSWVGPDASLKSISKVTATNDPDNETAVFVEWDIPQGYNGGWVDPSAISYKIVRSSSTTGDVTLEEAWKGTLPFHDTTLPGLGSYTYKIYTIYNGSTSWSAATSNKVSIAGTMALPYSQDFSASDSFDLFTLFHGSEATRDWSRSSSSANYWGGPTADAWMLTPRFHLEAGKAYSLSFSTRVSRATSPKNLMVYTGTQATAEALEPGMIFSEQITGTLNQSKQVTVSVETDGDYYIAFRCYGPSDSNDLYVDDITFEETDIIPAPVAKLTATAGDKGAMEAMLSWTNPSKTNAGTQLASISAVEIYNGAEKVADYTDILTPGAEASTTVAVANVGFNEFSIKVVEGENSSESTSSAKVWIGPDTPNAVTDLTVTVADNGSRLISFTAPSTSVNGGYVDYENIVYTVNRNDVTLSDKLTETTFTDDEADLELGKYTYSVTATYLDHESVTVSAAPMMLGEALSLPYNPDFSKANREHFDLWLSVDNNGTPSTAWKYDTLKEGFQGGSKNHWAFTPALKMDMGRVEIAYKASCYNWKSTEEMDIYLTQSTNPQDRPADIATASADESFDMQADKPLFKLIGSTTVDEANWPSEKKIEFEVPTPGIYHIGFHNKTGNMYLTINQADLKQTLSTGIDNVATDASGAISFNRATMSISAAGDINVYNLAGDCVAAGNGLVVVEDLANGLYIAVDANGNSLKFKK